MYGDVDYEDIKDLDIKIVTCKNGVGSITTLLLLESLLDNWKAFIFLYGIIIKWFKMAKI